MLYFDPLSLIFSTKGANDVNVFFIQKKSLKNTTTDRL